MSETKYGPSISVAENNFMKDPLTTTFFADDVKGMQMPDMDIFAAASIGAEEKVKELLES